MTLHRLCRPLWGLVFSLICVPMAQAEVLVYFWHDSQGLIHFSSQRPLDIPQVYAVHMPSYSREQEQLTKPLTYEALFETAREEAEAAGRAQLAKAAIAELQKVCEQAQRGKQVLLDNRRVRFTDDAGVTRDMTPEDKQRALAAYEQRIGETCHASPSLK